MATLAQQHYELSGHDSYISARFQAMASPCEFLFDTLDKSLADSLAQKGVAQARRIEQKFSRYAKDNLCFAINNAEGASVKIDDECYRLLAFAQTCFELSDGMFDLTSGVLRRAWKFDCSSHIPQQRQIDALLPLVGWEKVTFDQHSIQMKPGMEIDFGGIGKEYAVSAIADIYRIHAPDMSVLINLGGDIQITKPRQHKLPWRVGIENHEHVISIVQGALATSGDAKRFILRDGKRYSHILNPKTGWPVANAPSSVTTHAPLCVQAGCLATLSLLNGKDAERFLQNQDVKYWCTRV
ncbi:FAD:protein FMN transferase [Gilvimarinus polysaccharolyticus]|uniref:FAD:protein FMN transferase n=1 Tax=Gilvimarinus polysaccharolyticus TaxID=863921 RepID=UPI000A3EF029|nr:FAD:protein FMN transferase [Gilvimarinus polysaccharolyticus]